MQWLQTVHIVVSACITEMFTDKFGQTFAQCTIIHTPICNTDIFALNTPTSAAYSKHLHDISTIQIK